MKNIPLAFLLSLLFSGCASLPNATDDLAAKVRAELEKHGMMKSEVATGSMLPAMPIGRPFLIFHTKFSEVQVGQVIVYASRGGFAGPDKLICHRVIARRWDGFVTKGDANRESDPHIVTAENFVGTVLGY